MSLANDLASPATATATATFSPRVAELSYFFPAHNEAENIEALVVEALEVLPTLAERFEIICVDDGSRDGTGALADDLAAKHPGRRIAVVSHNVTNRAYLAGLMGRAERKKG